MLNIMRKHARSWLVKVIVAVITIVFVLWGVGSFRERRKSRIAVVNGEPVYYQEFNEVYNNLLEQLQKTFGNKLDEEMVKSLQVKRQALSRVIDKKLLLMEARKLDLQVTDDEVAQAITRIAAFQQGGVFNGRRYKDILGRFRMTPEQFEQNQKESMLLEKVRRFVSSGVKVSEPEALEWYKWAHATVNIDFVLFAPERHKGIIPEEKEIETYFNAHKEAYKTEAMVNTRYLRFDPESYKKGITVSEDQVKNYYDAHTDEFNTPATVEARHILIKVAPDADEQSVEAARQKAETVYKLAKAGQDFAELAKTYSEGPSSKNGGYLGVFKKEDMIAPFAEKAFSMKAGEISEPVRSEYGWHIIKVEQVNPASQKPYEAAADQIRTRLIEREAKARAYDAAADIYDTTFEGDDLSLVAQERNLPIETSSLFTRQGPQKGVSDPQKFASAAFGLEVMDISQIEEIGDVYYLIQVTEKVDPKIPPLADVAERVRADVIKQKQDEAAQKEAEAFLAAVQAGRTLADAAKKEGLSAETSDFFKRDDAIPNLGYAPEVAQAAFLLSDQNRLSDKVLKGPKGYYVICFKERKTPGVEGFETQKDQIKKGLLEQKQYQTYNSWLEMLHQHSEIEIESGFIS